MQHLPTAKPRRNPVPRWAVPAALGLAALTAAAARADDGADFFEKKIRPVLAETCYSCHAEDAKRIRGGLVVDSREGLLKGGDSGPALVPGHPEKSLLITAIRQEQELRMPPREKLPDQVIADFEAWVKMGAPDPRTTAVAVTPRKTFAITEADRRHWSYQPIGDPTPPPVQDEAWCRSDIDRFVLARLEDKGLRPCPPADPYTLLRRVKFDLTGLPPTPAEVTAFEKAYAADPRAAAEGLVDRLLASDQFGARWGRHWLDGVRYASDVDKSGLYRDWVVRAYNRDLPYDQFVRLQLAGDLIPARETDPAKVHASGASLDGVTATGMLALAVWEKVAYDLAAAEIVDSQIDVVGRQLLGLTLACARCHDHKFDPIATKDYYGLAGIFFRSHISPGKLIADGRLSDEVVQVPLLTKADAEKNARLDAQVAKLKEQAAALEKQAGPAARLHRTRAELAELTPKLAKEKAQNKAKLQKEIDKLRAEEGKLLADQKQNGWSADPPELARMLDLEKQAADLIRTKVNAPEAIGIQEGGIPGTVWENMKEFPVLIRGDHRKHGPIVPRHFPVILAGEDQPPVGGEGDASGRLALANWIASPDNPLTARVMANRVWLHLFGEGLVRTPDNFGTLGEPPANPELLDHLARRFIQSGWSVKALIREIMLSSTYQQSSFADEALLRADPENRLLGRMSRKRLEYEPLRDTLLFVSGKLGPGQGGQSTLYEPVVRNRVNPTRMMFDGPDPLTITPERPTTTTTPQALYLMNNPFVAGCARDLAARIQKDASLPDDAARVRRAYLALLGRPPSPEELRIGEQYLTRGTWPHYLQVLMCTNEFVYLD